jgi:hypothetical protein
VAGASATPARADGDPASDILATQTLFLPQDALVPAGQQAQLAALLKAAQRRGYPLRVAMIASKGDLGSVTELWRQPQSYAQFLGQELSLVFRGPLVVVMPSGFGLYHVTAAQTALAGLGAPGPGVGFGAAALAAIQRLAAASGHPLPAPSVIARSNPTGTDTASWIAFAIGSVLVLLAWSASLRARPLRGKRTAAG